MTAPSTQWRLESMQLVNWGGFEGHHQIDLSAPSTLITGASGTGKSTVLDAYIGLMMPSSVPFNGASNSNTTGRARSGDNRNVLRYMRGKLDDERQAGSGKLTEKVLRGTDVPTWSAIAATWINGEGRHFTAMRLFYATPSAEVLDQVTKRLITTDGRFNTAELADFAAVQFEPQKVRVRFAGLTNHGTYAAFAATVCSRLGIGNSGDGQRAALSLLARVQGGREFTTVDDLFKAMVLETPKTIDAAEAAVTHFADLEATYEAMRKAELQVAALEGITEIYDDLEAARAEIATMDLFGLKRSGPTPFLLWSRKTEDVMLQEETAALIADKKVKAAEARTARETEKGLAAELRSLEDAQRAAGGDELQSIESKLGDLDERHKTATETLNQYTLNTVQLGPPPTNADAFSALNLAGEKFITDDYPQQNESLRSADYDLWSQGKRTEELIKTLKTELKSLQSRDGLIPDELHQARLIIASELGCYGRDLPFVGELIDMDAEFEEWRMAADLAVRGFAMTMLIDDKWLDGARIKINELRLGSRLNFDGVNLGLSGTPAQDGDKRQLPSRFAFKDSPFSGWVDKQLRRRFNFTCVDSPADLKTVDRGITITGQTSDGRRGAHGGKRKPIIGFSNAERQNELLREIEDAKDEFTRIEKRQGELGLERRNLEALRIAYTYVKATSWDSIDVTGIDALRQDLQSRRNRILGANNLLAQLKEEADGVAAKLESATRQKVLAESAVEGLDKRHEALSVRHDEVMTEIWDLEDNHRVALSDELTQRLDAEFEKLATERRSDRLTVALGKLKDSLNSLTVNAEREVENHTRALETKFKAFLQQWERPDLGETLAFYPTYRDILLELKSEGLHERRSKFTREVNEWSGIDLLRVSSSYNDAMDEIDSRLDPVNEILRRLPFGAGRDRLKLRKHQTTTPDVSSFLRELRMLASNTAELESEEAATARFKTLQQFISRLSAANERDYLIDVRRHISIEAERIDADGVVKNVYVSIAGKSGGESQELIAFIIGSALRYQLGDEDWPRYAPVILDEAFIKADEAFTGRAVEAWKGLGFQLIVAAPDDKVNSIERHIDRILCVTKSSHHHSRVTELHDLPPTP